MTPVPSPGPLDVVVHSGPADWWVILAGLGPLAVLIAALLAFYINWRTLKQRTAADKTALEQKREADANALQQKTESDSRAEWWRRTQWALDRALDPDEGTKALGLATLEVLARSELARNEELELFDIAWKSVSGDENGDDNGDEAEADAGSGQEPAFVDGRGNLGENGTTDEDSTKEVGP
ncbi:MULTISPECIES: hypothetical protein [Micrococcaceae]|uniref:hypothetical protein n=1 Tax=Micrococcaceae TaxID=1268 RepID=UPI0023AF10DC|nr:hypothetical protein [Arthrobacter sp. NQ4]MDE8586550.1 hypothetical protein [Arthrobacter sp. NQ4]